MGGLKQVTIAIIVPLATLIISFILTFFGYLLWISWSFSRSSSMAGISAFVLGLYVAPVCALISVVVVIRWIIRKESELSPPQTDSRDHAK
jgi:TRAP-type C4-dicarboxylate transport system permease small subunit